MDSGKHHFHGRLQAPLCGVRSQGSLAAPKGVYEDDAFQHINQQFDLGIFSRSIVLRG
jgi:hypothetical protein